MPEITFVPYLEGQPYSAESLNSRFSTVEAGLEDLSPATQFGAEGLGSPHLPSLAGYVLQNSAPQTPWLIQKVGLGYSAGPPNNYSANAMFFGPGDQNLTTNPVTGNPYTWTGSDFPGTTGANLESDPLSWKPVAAGDQSSGVQELSVGFYETGPTLWHPLYLDQPTAVDQDEVWAQGLVVLANLQFKKIERHDDDGIDNIRFHLGTRFYAAFCIQILTWEDAYTPGDPSPDPTWRVVPRTIRFVSEKNLPNAGHSRAAFAHSSGRVFKDTEAHPGTPAPFPYLNYHAARESWIDIPLRTVIRKEDLLASGQNDSPTTGPILGVRVAVGAWLVWPGPVQPGSYAGGVIFAGNGAPVSFEPQQEIQVRQGNLTVFPLHAGEDINWRETP